MTFLRKILGDKTDKWQKKIVSIFYLFLLIIVLTLIPPIDNKTKNNKIGIPIPTSIPEKTKNTVRVERVIDGDTIQLETGEKVRYIGIDTPETVHPNKPIECYGQEASQKNKELVEGKEISLEKDISETDKYGRLLRYIWVEDILINEYLVREGYANSSSYPPDVKYQDRFIEAEKLAREEEKGLWGNICNITPTPTLIPTIKHKQQLLLKNILNFFKNFK
jgi:micrococcal nuclease